MALSKTMEYETEAGEILTLEADLTIHEDSEGDHNVINGVRFFRYYEIDEIRVFKDGDEITATLTPQEIESFEDYFLTMLG